MITGKTTSGFEYSLNERNLNDFRLVRALARLDKNPLALPDVVELLFGEDQAESLYDHLTQDDGSIPTDLLEKEVIEIFNAQKEIKNSSSSPESSTKPKKK